MNNKIGFSLAQGMKHIDTFAVRRVFDLGAKLKNPINLFSLASF